MNENMCYTKISNTKILQTKLMRITVPILIVAIGVLLKLVNEANNYRSDWLWVSPIEGHEVYRRYIALPNHYLTTVSLPTNY